MGTNGNGKKLWWAGTGLTIMGVVFGAGGATYVTRADVARHDKAIESLTAKAQLAEVGQGRVEERLKSIEASLTEIKHLLRARP
jgi:hypothetical protein